MDSVLSACISACVFNQINTTRVGCHPVSKQSSTGVPTRREHLTSGRTVQHVHVGLQKENKMHPMLFCTPSGQYRFETAIIQKQPIGRWYMAQQSPRALEPYATSTLRYAVVYKCSARSSQLASIRLRQPPHYRPHRDAMRHTR